ncbi:flagellin N-terminal helical domain-containing protein [Geobacillus sp. JS12]|uniref:flagellin N-terminal helical domain-containing protein n=1 Tax=Geobacillus sp. JS12 TaxID=1813182 RepID=UPI00078B3289|nr:flagellin [Geobacillus sp. JS12]AMQ21724.1 flagellin [Geobacillus sp. JS12]
MRINHNIAALNTYRQLTIGQGAAAKNMEKLSSGLRINRAGDDAAGLAISEKMRGQIRGLEQASRNAQDAISLIQTAEGALNETHSILQRMRELAVQAANETTTQDDRNQIQKEFDQLKSEIDRISTQTDFNTKNLLNGSFAANTTISGTNTAKIKSGKVVDDTVASATYQLAISGVTSAAVANGINGGTNVASVAITTGQEANVDLGVYELKISDDPNNSGRKIATLTNKTTGAVQTVNNIDPTNDGSTFTIGGFTVTKQGGAGAALANGTYTFDVQATFTATLTNTNTGTVVGTQTFTNYKSTDFTIGGINFGIKADLATGADTNVVVQNNALTFQIGANTGQTTKLSINDMSSTALGVSNLDVTSVSGASSAITAVDDAIRTVSTERSKLGAIQNRLEHTINNLGTASENLTAAESRIRDVDYALAA